MSTNVLGPCEYCTRPGKQVAFQEPDGADIFLCAICQKLLKSPATALPLIRGHISILGRELGPNFQSQINKFMGKISDWGNRN